ncbi:hypothetical protein CR513_60967, partial [Mucuna pruriens]
MRRSLSKTEGHTRRSIDFDTLGPKSANPPGIGKTRPGRTDGGMERATIGHIKAQVIADFLIELTPKGGRELEGEWYLSIDGSSNHTGSGAGIVLEGPIKVLIEQSLHFEFKASNNQAEYEALLDGMKLAQELGTKKLTAKSDSMLVTGQINGDYQAKDPQLAKYQ